MKPGRGKRIFYVLAVILLAVVVLGGVLLFAAPGRLATKISVTLTSGEGTVSRRLSGRLTTFFGRPVARQVVELECRSPDEADWSFVATEATGILGGCSWKILQNSDRLYRLRYAGNREYRSSESVAKTIPGLHYALKFADEFTGSTVDTETWTPQMPWGDHTENQLEVFVPEALTVRNGKLVITARRRPRSAGTSEYPYYSGAVSAHGTGQYNFKYGYVETRTKMPKGMGLWPAVWLLPLDPSKDCELDVMEARGHLPQRNIMTVHFKEASVKYPLAQSGEEYDGADMSEAYQTFGLYWSPSTLIWTRDGIERFRFTEPPRIPQTKMYLIANLQLGDWGRTPNAKTKFPASLFVDYIRVYQH